MPWTAAMTGLLRSGSSWSPPKPPTPYSPWTAAPSAAALRSHPAQKNLSPSVRTIATRRSGSSLNDAKTSPISRLVARSIALAGGRSRVTSRIASSTVVLKTSVISGSQRPQQGAADDVPLDLRGPVPDALDARVAPDPLQRQLVHQPHATVDLDRLVGDHRQHLGRLHLGHGDVGVGRRALVDLPRGVERHQLR